MLVNSKSDLLYNNLDYDLFYNLVDTKDFEGICDFLKKRGIEASLAEVKSIIKSFKFLSLPAEGIEKICDEELKNVVGGKLVLKKILEDVLFYRIDGEEKSVFWNSGSSKYLKLRLDIPVNNFLKHQI